MERSRVAFARSEIVRRGGSLPLLGSLRPSCFLCGMDPFAGQNFEHRRDWLHRLQEQLAGHFGAEIPFHAKMGNEG